ncbi:MAG: helix-turn-helix domain-containing protein [Casimicrobiaceae bacterium]
MDSVKREGTQTLARAMALLRELAARGHFGWSLGDLADRCGLDKGTAHRLLAHLKHERMVQQRLGDRRYVAGPMLFELGLGVTDHAAFVTAAGAPLARVAKRLGCISFLLLRSDSDFVCAARAGAYPVKSLSIEVGTRRALVTSAGGVAILIAMSGAEGRAIVARDMGIVTRAGGLPPAALQRILRHSRRLGFGINEGNLIPGWNAYALAVRNSGGAPIASLMIAGDAAHFALTTEGLLEALRAEVTVLERDAARLLPASS